MSVEAAIAQLNILPAVVFFLTSVTMTVKTLIIVSYMNDILAPKNNQGKKKMLPQMHFVSAEQTSTYHHISHAFFRVNCSHARMHLRRPIWSL